ncbi:hypothetical protein ACTGYO_11195, partial [Streptococcus suis]
GGMTPATARPQIGRHAIAVSTPTFVMSASNRAVAIWPARLKLKSITEASAISGISFIKDVEEIHDLLEARGMVWCYVEAYT